MPTFRGAKNVSIQPEGAEKPVVESVYDHEARDYVAALSDADAKKYGKALVAEGMSETASETPAPADA